MRQSENMEPKSKNLDLIYVYIRKYKIFTNQGFCFSPEYEISCNYEPDKAPLLSLNIEKKKNFVDIFKNENANVSVICGKNGCGKSTLLEAISNENSKNIVCVYKDNEGQFFATEEISIKHEGKKISVGKNNTILNSSAYHISQSDFSLKDIVEYYTKNQNVFDGILNESDKLFTHFQVKIWNLDELVSKVKSDDEIVFSNEIQNTDFEKNPLLLYVLLSNDAKNNFFKIYKEQKINGDNRGFLELLEEYIYASCNTEKYEELLKLQNQIFKEHLISDFESIKTKLNELNTFYNEMLKEVFTIHKPNENFDSYIFYDGFARFGITERHIQDLSSGEIQEFKYRYQLFNVLKDSNVSTVLIDEPEAYLHPEWCRRFIYDFLKAFQSVKEILKRENLFEDRKINFIVSTHSPFILSDVTNDYIIYLERQPDGSTKQVKKKKDTFAGNIGELFTENFFMENTIGEFSRSKIQNVIEKLKSRNPIPNDELETYKQLIEKVGDDLLRTLLADMWEAKK